MQPHFALEIGGEVCDVVDVVVRDAEEAVVAAAVLARQAAAVRVHRLNGLHRVGSHEDRARLHRGGLILSSTGGKISQIIGHNNERSLLVVGCKLRHCTDR